MGFGFLHSPNASTPFPVGHRVATYRPHADVKGTGVCTARDSGLGPHLPLHQTAPIGAPVGARPPPFAAAVVEDKVNLYLIVHEYGKFIAPTNALEAVSYYAVLDPENEGAVDALLATVRAPPPRPRAESVIRGVECFFEQPDLLYFYTPCAPPCAPPPSTEE